MATAIINTKSDGTQRYNLRVNLDGRYFNLEFFWNSRDSAWYLQLSSASGGLLATRKLVCGMPLFASKADVAFPYGELIVVDPSKNNGNPGLNELGPGQRCLLTFTNAEDFLT